MDLDLSKIKKVYFIGIGGIGISAIARMMLHGGKVVTGQDMQEGEIVEELRKLAEKKRNFRVIFTMTSQRGWTGERARINPSFIKRYVKSPKTKLFYLAGSPRMNYDITGALLRLSVPSKNIKTEDFTGY